MDASQWDARYSASDTSTVWGAQPNEFVVSYLSDLRPNTMLDVAGGEGRNAIWFARRGWAVEVVDFSAAALERFDEWAVHERLKDRCVANCVDVTKPYDVLVAPAGLVVMAYLQIPEDQLSDAIREAVVHLRPGGIFFGVFHERGNIAHGFGGPQDPEVLPTVESLNRIAGEVGLTVDVLEIRDRAVSTAEGERVARDVVIRAFR